MSWCSAGSNLYALNSVYFFFVKITIITGIILIELVPHYDGKPKHHLTLVMTWCLRMTLLLCTHQWLRIIECPSVYLYFFKMIPRNILSMLQCIILIFHLNFEKFLAVPILIFESIIGTFQEILILLCSDLYEDPCFEWFFFAHNLFLSYHKYNNSILLSLCRWFW